MSDTPVAYSFETIRQIIWSCDNRFIGPTKPIDDPKLVAGLLFVPHDSWSTRTIRSNQRYFNGLHHVHIALHHDFADSDYHHIPITTKARRWLLNEHYIEGIPEQSCTDMDTLRLSRRGNQAVVTDWFKGETTVIDYLAAGASIHTDGRITC